MNAYEQMREALESLSNAAMVVLLCNGDEDAEMSHLSDCIDNAKAAISMPRRNSDKFTDWKSAWDHWFQDHHEQSTRSHSATIDFLGWLFDSEEKGGAECGQ